MTSISNSIRIPHNPCFLIAKRLRLISITFCYLHAANQGGLGQHSNCCRRRRLGHCFGNYESNSSCCRLKGSLTSQKDKNGLAANTRNCKGRHQFLFFFSGFCLGKRFGKRIVNVDRQRCLSEINNLYCFLFSFYWCICCKYKCFGLCLHLFVLISDLYWMYLCIYFSNCS